MHPAVRITTRRAMADPGYTWRDGHPQRRAAWAAILAHHPIVCGAPGCGRLVHADPAANWDGKPWHLGHATALAYGGDGTDSTPWHATCNLRDAAHITNSRHAPPVTRREW